MDAPQPAPAWCAGSRPARLRLDLGLLLRHREPDGSEFVSMADVPGRMPELIEHYRIAIRRLTAARERVPGSPDFWLRLEFADESGEPVIGFPW